MVTRFEPLNIPIIYVNSLTPKIFQYFLQKWNLCNFGLFLPICCHINALCSLKIQIAYLKSTTPKPYHICRNWQYIAYRTEICLSLAFLYKFGCYGYSLCSPEIFISIFELSDNENPTIHAKIVSIAFTELKSAELWFILT